MICLEPSVIQEKRRNSLCGTECEFIPIDDDIGVKVYSTISERYSAYKQQKLAAEHGLGPEVYGTIDLKYGFGYITEIVEVPDCYQENGSYCFIPRDGNYYVDEQQELCAKLLLIGIKHETINDIYVGNIGFKNGQVFFIDFGR